MTQPESNEVYFVRKQYRTITFQDLVDFLNDKLPLIRVGKYFPTTENLKRDLPNCTEFGRHLIDYVSKWMSSTDLPFSSITEMLIYFNIKDPLSIQERLDSFLDSLLDDINNLKYVPTLDKVIHDSGLKRLTSDHITKWFRTRYNSNKILYSSLTELKIRADTVRSISIYQFLDEKRSQIEQYEFVPTVENIIKERPDFKNFENLSAFVYTWLKQNNLPSISELKELTNQTSYRKKLYKLLNSLIDKVKDFSFLPTIKNIKDLTHDFDNFDDSNLSLYITRWLKENKIANTLTDYLYNFGIKSQARCLRDFLDSKRSEIVQGKYFPTIKNLRKEQNLIGINVDSITVLNTIRAEWFNKNIGKSMTQLIEEFDPPYAQLGYDIQLYGYPAQFRSQKLRIMKAEFQIFRLLSDNKLLQFSPPYKFSSLESLFSYLKRNEQWKFMDLLTGELFTFQDFLRGNIIFHHLNFRKGDLNPDNLCYLFRDTHGFINASARYDKLLLEFFSNLLRENIKSLKKCLIPKSWSVDWRNLAIENGINVPSNRYIKTVVRPTILNFSNRFKDFNFF